MRDRAKLIDRLLLFFAAILIVVLVGLVSAMIFVFSNGSRENEKFDIGMITSGEGDDVDISPLFIPEFIGMMVDGVQTGVSFSDKVLYDITNKLAPVISYVLESDADESETDWNSLAEAENSVYVRFHTQMPLELVRMFCDGLAANEHKARANAAYVREMFVIPYSETNGEMKIIVRSSDGVVKSFTVDDPRVFLTAGDISVMTKSYSTSLDKFVFAKDSFASLSHTEPLFAESVKLRSVSMTKNTAQMVYNSNVSLNRLIGIFGMNPEKVSPTHTEDESVTTYIDEFGVLYIRESSFEYRSSSDGGLKLREIVGIPSDRLGMSEFIKATYSIFRSVRAVNKTFAGGEAGVFLSSFTSVGGKVTVELSYSFDNIPIEDVKPAIRAVYENGVLKEADVFTISVRPKSDRNEIMTEWGLASHLDARRISAEDVNLVYRADFSSESVRPEWRAKVAQ